MISNPQTFQQFCREYGILAPDDIPPGKWIDCPTESHPRKKKGRIKLADDGRAGFAIDHIQMTEFLVWKSSVATDTRPEFNHAAIAERIALRNQEEKRGTMRAQAIYAASKPLAGPHGYLERKRMTAQGLRGVRVDDQGWLVIPMYRDGKIISCQRVNVDGTKKFVYGAPVKHSFFTLWRPVHCLTVLVEGLATAQTVFEACPLARVVVCFSAANLTEVAKRESWSGSVAVAGDNDLDTEERLGRNPGAEAAKETAKAIGCGYALPTIPTDFNDMFCDQLECLEAANAEKSFPATPIALRRGALAPVQSLIMRAAKKV